MTDSGSSVLLNGQQVDHSTIVRPGDKLTIPETVQRPFLFSDVFLFIDYSLPKTASTSYELLRNGEPIGFNDPIFSGDSLGNQIRLLVAQDTKKPDNPLMGCLAILFHFSCSTEI